MISTTKLRAALRLAPRKELVHAECALRMAVGLLEHPQMLEEEGRIRRACPTSDTASNASAVPVIIAAFASRVRRMRDSDLSGKVGSA